MELIKMQETRTYRNIDRYAEKYVNTEWNNILSNETKRLVQSIA